MGTTSETPTGRLTVAELLRRWPGAAEALVRRGMACPGCAMALFDTVHAAAETYGVDESSLLEEVRRTIVVGVRSR